MKQYFSKFLTLLIVLLCSCTMIVVGCSNGNDSTSEEQSSSSQNSVTSSETTSLNQTSSNSIRDLQAASFAVDLSNARLIYCIGDTFTNEGAVPQAVRASGSKFALNANEYTITTDFDSTKTGKYTVTLTYLNFDPISYDVYVCEVPEVNNNKVEFLLDASYTGNPGVKNADGQVQFASVKQAVNMAQFGGFANEVEKKFVFKAGKFVDKVMIPATVKNVVWEGSTEGDSIVSYGDCSSVAGGTDKSASVTIKCDGFKATNIVFENSYDYINGTESDKQALACQVEGDKCIFIDCTFLGYQDTLQAKNGRHYYKDCTIKGTTDFIFGKAATCVFENCDIVTRFTGEAKSNNGYITAHSGTAGNVHPDDETKKVSGQKYGYVFLGCRLTAEEGVTAGSVSLGRPWAQYATVAYINCDLGEHISTIGYGDSGRPRYDAMSNNTPEFASFVEYGNTGSGAISEAVVGCSLLTKEQADEYTIANIFAKDNGTHLKYGDSWVPAV